MINFNDRHQQQMKAHPYMLLASEITIQLLNFYSNVDAIET